MQQYVECQSTAISRHLLVNQHQKPQKLAVRLEDKEMSVVSQTVNQQLEEVIEEASKMLRGIRQSISSFLFPMLLCTSPSGILL